MVAYTDGSSLTLGRGGGIAPGGGETVCHKSQIFDTIRPLDEVASVTVGDIVIPVEAGG